MSARPGVTDTLGVEAPGRRLTVYAALGGLLITVVACALVTGAGDVAPDELRGAILRLRVGRTAAAFMAGGALAVGGVLVQGLFRFALYLRGSAPACSCRWVACLVRSWPWRCCSW